MTRKKFPNEFFRKSKFFRLNSKSVVCTTFMLIFIFFFSFSFAQSKSAIHKRYEEDVKNDHLGTALKGEANKKVLAIDFMGEKSLYKVNLSQDDILVIRAICMPSTGFTWQFNEKEVNHLELIAKRRAPVLGIGKTDCRIVFKGTAAGISEIRLKYSRVWEEKAPQKECVVRVSTMGPYTGKFSYKQPKPVQRTVSLKSADYVLPGAPVSWDWRNNGGETPIKNQISNSCWAFGAVASYESVIKIRSGVERDLSEQWLCNCNSYGFSCSGGGWFPQQMFVDYGAVYESEVPFQGNDGYCYPPYNYGEQANGWGYTDGVSDSPWPNYTHHASIQQIKDAVYNYGPVAANAYIGDGFNYYTGGILTSDYGATAGHIMCIVGWDDYGQYWIVKNSWGTSWGESGYIRIQYDLCEMGWYSAWIDYQGSGPTNYTLTTNVSGNGSISLNPSGGTYTAGTVVTVTANPGSGSQFTGWSGDLSGSSNPTTITMNSNKSITASFSGGSSYCTSSGNDYSYEWIAGVQVGSLNNTSGAAGYTDFTNQTVNLSKGSSVSVSLTPGFASSSYSEYWKIWIDLNQNGDFTDSGEELFSGNGTSTVSGSLTVPSSATDGTTRMRVTMQYNSAPSSCGTFTYGEVEDYTANIAGGTTYYTLSTNVNGQGNISLSPSGGTYAAGTVVTVTANASSGWQFDNWSGNLSGSSNPTTITMNGNRSITANFSEATQYFTLSTSTYGQGSISLSPSGGTYAAGTVVTVTANPSSGWQFDSWGGDLSGSSNPTTITMNGNRTVIANFTEATQYYTLTTNVTGSGSISLSPSGGTYAAGTVVTLTANPGSGYQFTGWSGDLGGSNNPATLTMNGNRSVTANFSPVTQYYTLSTNVNGSGSISLSPSGGTYAAGTVVTVTANPSSGWQFESWSGNLSGSSNPETITMNGNRSVTATFIESSTSYCTSSGNNYSYEWIAGVQVGSLNNTSGAAGYTDFTNQTVNLSKGSSASVSLTPGFSSSSYTEYWKIWIDLNQNSDFTDSGEELFSGSGSSNVSGSLTVPSSALSGTTRMRVTMQYNSAPSSCGTFTYGEVEDYTVNVTGGTTTYTLSTSVNGQGSITLSPSGGTYAAGTVVTVTANPNSGWQFDSWGGNLSGSNNPTTITMNGNRSITANFTEATQFYTLSTNTSGQGSVSLSPSGGTYAAGTVVTLTANPSSGWQFDGWSGDLNGTSNPATITMNGNRSVTANFSEVSQYFTLSTSTSGQGSISLSPSGGTYAAGTVVTVTANPSSGWQFDGWSGDLSGSSNPTTITMNGNRNVTATFTESTASYCTSNGNDYSYEWISGVQVGSFSNSSGAAGYTDFTSMVVSLSPGSSHSVSLTPGFSSSSYAEYWRIWIDFNTNGTFDSNEMVFEGSGSGVVNGTISIPSSLSGTTRMRISMKYNAYPTACESFTYGEVEDYTVEFSGSVTPIFQNLTVQESNNLIQQNQGNPNFVILDVRTASEFNAERLANSINLDFYSSSFDNDLNQLDKSRTYLVYCNSGNRSAQTLSKMQTMNFQVVYNMLGGITEWIAQGYPTI